MKMKPRIKARIHMERSAHDKMGHELVLVACPSAFTGTPVF